MPAKAQSRWQTYVRRVVGDDRNAEISRKTGIDQGTLSRWFRKDGPAVTVTPPAARALARGYGRPILEAFTHAGILFEEETGISAEPLAVDWTQISDAELLSEVGRRIARGRALS